MKYRELRIILKRLFRAELHKSDTVDLGSKYSLKWRSFILQFLSLTGILSLIASASSLITNG